MNEVHIRVDERGRHQPYRNAIDVGPAFVSPRDAVTYANELEAMPSVSPLRGSGMGSPAAPAAPSVGAGSGVDSIPDEPRGASGQSGG